MVAFPSLSKGPQRDGWNYTAPDGVRRTAMDAGPGKSRVESTAEPGFETLPFKLPNADVTTLLNFYAANKAERIDYTHPVHGAVQIKFRAPPAVQQRGRWRWVTLNLEIYH